MADCFAFCSPDVVVWDALRVLVTVAGTAVVIGSMYEIQHRPSWAVPIIGMQLILAGGVAGRVLHLGEPPTLPLAFNLGGVALLVWWLIAQRQRRRTIRTRTSQR